MASPDIKFFDKATSLPLISDSLSFVKTKYLEAKVKNGYVEEFLMGLERAVYRSFMSAFIISTNVVKYEYFDEMGCKGLDKIEEVIPSIKKPTDQFVKDSRAYALTKLGGKTGQEDAPESVTAALSSRGSLMLSSLSKVVSENLIGKAVIEVTEHALESTDRVLGSLIPQFEEELPCEDSSVTCRIYCIASKTRAGLISAASEVSKERKQTPPKDLSVLVLVDAFFYGFSNLYKLLEVRKVDTDAIERVFNNFALTVVGTTMILLTKISATNKELVDFFEHLIMQVKAATFATVQVSKHAGFKAYKICWKASVDGVNYTRKCLPSIGFDVDSVERTKNLVIERVRKIEKSLLKKSLKRNEDSKDEDAVDCLLTTLAGAPAAADL